MSDNRPPLSPSDLLIAADQAEDKEATLAAHVLRELAGQIDGLTKDKERLDWIERRRVSLTREWGNWRIEWLRLDGRPDSSRLASLRNIIDVGLMRSLAEEEAQERVLAQINQLAERSRLVRELGRPLTEAEATIVREAFADP